MRPSVNRDRAGRFLLLSTAVLVFYLSYRYPFQINSSGTSPTYSDTPLVLQLGKFILAVAICLYAIVKFKIRRIDADGWAFCLLFAGLISFSVFKACIGDGVFLEFAFWPLVAIILCAYSRPIDIRLIDGGIKMLFWISTVVEVVQIGLFVFFERLPALAWGNTISIRFGSFLDDPNGFAALCFLFLGWSWCRPTAFARMSLTLLVVLMLLASQSLTAIAFLAPTLAIWGIVKLSKRPVALLFCISLLVAALLMGGDSFIDLVARDVYEYKQGSIEMHASFNFIDLVHEGVLQVLIGSNEYKFYESWWAQSIYNWGIIWTLALLIPIIFTILAVIGHIRRHRSMPYSGALMGMLLFMIYVTAGSINLPFFLVFPINYILFAIVSIFMMRKVTFPSIKLPRPVHDSAL